MSNEINVLKAKYQDEYWQYVRAICIISVILIHSKNRIGLENNQNYPMNYYYWIVLRQFINFPVATFIFLSGYFIKIKGLNKFKTTYILERIKRLIIPFLSWSTFYTLINIVTAKGKIDITETIIGLLFGLSQGHLYYIVVLIQLTLITPFVVKYIKAKRAKVFMFLITPIYILCTYYYVVKYSKQMPNYQTFFPAWFIFYYIGLLLNTSKFKPNFTIQRIVVSTIVLMTAFLLSILEGLYLLGAGFPIGFAISQIKVSSFIYTFSVISLFLIFMTYVKNTNFKLLKYIGDNSYGIFFIHMFWVVINDKLLSGIA